MSNSNININKWTASKPYRERPTDYDDRMQITDGESKIAMVNTTRDGNRMGLANARLIAAAPDLLAACKAAHLAVAESDEELSRKGVANSPARAANATAIEIIEAAITKAGGEA